MTSGTSADGGSRLECGQMAPGNLRSVGRTDVGRKRPHNEDSFFADDEIGLYVVADGVGGHAKGEIASAEAVDQIVSWVRSKNDAKYPN